MGVGDSYQGDEHEEPLLMLSCNRGGVSHPLTAEIWTMWRALKLCVQLLLYKCGF